MLLLGGSFAAAIALGMVTAQNPMISMVPAAMFGVVLILISPTARLGFLVFAGLATLGSSSGLSLVKVLYLLGSSLAFMMAITRVQFGSTSSTNLFTRPLLRLGILWSGLIVFSLTISIANSAAPALWIRDVTPYLLFATIPIFARDNAVVGNRRVVLGFLLAAGLLAALAFSITFTTSRGYAALPIEHLVLPSFLLPAAAFSYAVSAALHQRGFRAGWMAFAAAILALYLITGTRSSFVLLLSPIAIVLCTRQGRWRRLIGLILGGLVFALVLILFSQSLANTFGIDLSQVIDRLSTTTEVFNTESSAGQSFDARSIQTDVAWRAFISNPMFGVGPGTVFEWSDRFGTYSGINIDSPVGFPAKFGTVGLLVLIITIIEYVLVMVRIRRMQGVSVSWLAMVGFLTIVGAWMTLGSPFEDKGFSFGLLLLLTLTVIEADHQTDSQAQHITGSRPDV